MGNINKMEESPLNQHTLNPMVFHQVYLHITEQIFDKLDNKSLKYCRETSKSWQIVIDNRNILWNKIAKKKGGNETFHLACINDHIKMANMLIQNVTAFEIDVNVKTWDGVTPFHFACQIDNSKVAEILVQKSAELNIDLNAKDRDGLTGLHFACINYNIKIAELIVQKSAEFNINLNEKDRFGRTAFHLACTLWGKPKIVNMMIDKANHFKLDLQAKDNKGRTGYEIAQSYGKHEIVNILKTKMLRLDK